jgi:hypothetical protein
MAVSAGAQKRKFLRRQADGTGVARGFLLDRARLVVAPVGLEAVVRRLTGQSPTRSPLALDCACRIVETLTTCLAAAGQVAHLDAVLADAEEPAAFATPQQQLQAASKLHALAGHGTAWVQVAAGARAEQVLELLRFAWKRSEVGRVRFRASPDVAETIYDLE